MPGRNCCFVGCGRNRRMKAIGIFKLPKARNKEYAKWRTDWLNTILKQRVVDPEFRKLIQNDTVFTFQYHFHKEDIIECKCIL